MPQSASSPAPATAPRPTAIRGGHAGSRSPRMAGQRGATSVELAIVFPIVLLVVMTLIQAGLWFYARSIALGAAQEGAREGRLQPASTGRAQAAAERFLDQTAQDLLTGRTVAVTGTPASIEVKVTGTSISLLPGLSGWSVTQSAVGPIERPTP